MHDITYNVIFQQMTYLPPSQRKHWIEEWSITAMDRIRFRIRATADHGPHHNLNLNFKMHTQQKAIRFFPIQPPIPTHLRYDDNIQ